MTWQKAHGSGEGRTQPGALNGQNVLACVQQALPCPLLQQVGTKGIVSLQSRLQPGFPTLLQRFAPPGIPWINPSREARLKPAHQSGPMPSPPAKAGGKEEPARSRLRNSPGPMLSSKTRPEVGWAAPLVAAMPLQARARNRNRKRNGNNSEAPAGLWDCVMPGFCACWRRDNAINNLLCSLLPAGSAGKP